MSLRINPTDMPEIALNTCFLPDQYAIIWAWNGSGDLMSYDPIAGVWTDHGKVQVNGSNLGGYSLAVNNNTNNPVLVFQRGGNLYSAPLSDPTNAKLIGPHNNAAFGSSYPCGAFRPGTEEFWVGIGSGSTVGIADLGTGGVTTLGTLTDARDGATLSASPGDWFFDPEGNLFLMARDNRGALFGQDTNTVLWQIDPGTLVTTRLSLTDNPFGSGTGAAWAAAGTYLLSSGNTITTYRIGADVAPGTDSAWTQEIPPAPHSINDLGQQWVTPDPIPVVVCIQKGKNDEVNDGDVYTVSQDPVDPAISIIERFEPTLPGRYGICEAEGNPFVTDPIAPAAGDSESKSPDKVWNKGCADVGEVLWRDSCETEERTYMYGTSGVETSVAPAGFLPFECGAVTPQTETQPFCNEDNAPPTQAYRREDLVAGDFVWYDETGTIPEPTNSSAGFCPNLDPLLPVTEQVVCWNDETYVRTVKEQYAENADGLPELVNYQILFYNENGVGYDSGVLAAGTPDPSPTNFYIGECVEPYVRTEDVVMFEKDARFLLLIDSGGGFARYSFLTKTWSNVSTLSVASAGGSADYDNFLLYSFVAPDQLVTVDVNTDTQLPNITLTDGVLKPGVTANPKTFSAASFRVADGMLYAQDTGGADAGLYRVDVTTGVVDFVTTTSGVSGSGTSIMIDNTTDTLIVNGSNLSYQVDWVTGVATLWGNPPLQPNGGTFDDQGNAYVTQGLNTYCLPSGADPNDPAAWNQIIDDWGPGANSIAFYRTVAAQPACFIRRYGFAADGTRTCIGDFEYGQKEDTERAVVGDAVCADQCIIDAINGQPGGGGGGASAADIGAEVEAQDTYKGPTAAEIADAIVVAERTRVEGRVQKFTGNATQQLTVAPGARGTLIAIEDSGGGLVYFTLDGSAPSNTAGANRGEVTGPYHSGYHLRNVDLSLLRFDGSAGNSDYTVWYEVYT